MLGLALVRQLKRQIGKDTAQGFPHAITRYGKKKDIRTWLSLALSFG